MKKTILSLICLGSAAAVFAGTTNQLTDDRARVSYAIGMLTGHQWQQQEIDFDVNVYAQGIKDGMAGGTTLLTPQEAQETLAKFKQEFGVKQQKSQAEKSVKNKADGDAFLAANKKNPGVKTISATTPQGGTDELQYLVLTDGSGVTPTANDTVTVNYRGTLIDGTEFDSSYKRNEPTSFPLNGVIPCWTEGVQRMKVGGKSMLVCPSNLAYGDQGRPSIPGVATLIFEIELLEVGGK